jgi:hypothetical protein
MSGLLWISRATLNSLIGGKYSSSTESSAADSLKARPSQDYQPRQGSYFSRTGGPYWVLMPILFAAILLITPAIAKLAALAPMSALG